MALRLANDFVILHGVHGSTIRHWVVLYGSRVKPVSEGEEQY